jgi:hypothetical protein
MISPVTSILRSSHQSKFTYLFSIGEIGDFSKNVNLVELRLNGNSFTGNVNLDFQPSDLKLNFIFFRVSARFFKEHCVKKTVFAIE